jgi:tRNA_anti-like
MSKEIYTWNAGKSCSQPPNRAQETQKIHKNKESLMLAVTFSIITLLAGCKPQNNSNQQGYIESQSPSNELFTQRQKNILLLLVYSNIRNFTNGENNIAEEAGWSNGVIVSTAEEIQKKYETNEVAADNMLRGKEVIVSATVASINRGMGETYYLKLKGGENMFIKPQAIMADGQKDYLANLKKGQKVGLACVVDGMLLGSATLKRCIPSDEWAKQRAIDAISKMNKRTIKNDRNTGLFVAGAVAADEKLPLISSCDTSTGDDCAAEVRSAFPKISKSDIASALKKYEIDPSKNN